MNKLPLLLLFALLSSCTYMVPGVDVEAMTIDEILFQVRQIDYLSDWETADPELDHWQSPKQTAELGTGDCEDHAIYFMYLAKQYLGWECDFVAVYVYWAGGHVYAERDGMIYDMGRAYKKEEYPWDHFEMFRLSYDVAMTFVTGCYTRSVVVE